MINSVYNTTGHPEKEGNVRDEKSPPGGRAFHIQKTKSLRLLRLSLCGLDSNEIIGREDKFINVITLAVTIQIETG